MLNNIVSILDTGVAGGAGDYESIATVTVGSGGSSSISFSSIPSTYKHLQLRIIARQAGTSATGAFAGLRFNSDAGNNYAVHELKGDGSSAGAANWTSIDMNYLQRVTSASQQSNNFGALVVDILDYANTNKYKTVRTLGGFDDNGSGRVSLTSGLWQSTSAISTITLPTDTGNYQQYSHFALYGVKG